MKQKYAAKGLIMIGSLRKAGVTTYVKQGQVITRVSNSDEKRSNTLGQFNQRQKMRHTTALWKMMKYGCKEMMFTQRKTAYQNFASLANRLPTVFVERIHMTEASFLMPGIPISDGTLPTIKLELGEVDGEPALLTDLEKDKHCYQEKLFLYTAEQTGEDTIPRVRFSMREILRTKMTLVDGHFVLKGEEFSDDKKGWALVQVIGERCSAQTIVTRCTFYKQYTTEEAMKKSAKSYGGLTEAPYLSPQ